MIYFTLKLEDCIKGTSMSMKPTATLGMGTTDGKIFKHLFDINDKFSF